MTHLNKHISEALGLGLFNDYFIELGSFKTGKEIFRLGNPEIVFDLASLTKALVTGPLIYGFLKGQKIARSEKVGPFLNMLGNSLKRPQLADITFAELLSHTSGLPSWRNFWINRLSFDSEQTDLFKTRVSHLVDVIDRSELTLGKKVDLYSDVGFIILGFILEGTYGESLETIFSNNMNFSGNIGSGKRMRGLTPSVRFSGTGFCKIRSQELFGDVHDENCASLGGFCGHAGLFSSGKSLVEFLTKDNPLPFWHEYLLENYQLTKKHSRSGLLGMRRADDASSSMFGSGYGIGHLGFTGTAFWLDMKSSHYAIFLTNRIVSSRTSIAIKDLRRRVFTELSRMI